MITKKQTKRLMVMAGGTGGHVFPGLAVANYLIAEGWQVRWLGTADRIEANLVPQYGIEIEFINISGLRGNDLTTKLKAPVCILHAVSQARSIMRTWRPDVVLGMGGYVSGPGGLAAWSYGIPLVLHEQNSIAGLTNRLLTKIASKVLQAFPGALQHAEVVGNPVRANLLALQEPSVRLRHRVGPLRVLVVGGSQGAQVLNNTMPAVAAKLSGTITLLHQVGYGALASVKLAYATAGEFNHMVVEFIDDIATAYTWADIVVCRSGALTVSEIAAIGLPALFVPCGHKDRHQYWNAHKLEQIGAAKIIEEKEWTVAKVSDTLAGLKRPVLLEMAQCARTAAIYDATERVARVVKVTAAQAINPQSQTRFLLRG